MTLGYGDYGETVYDFKVGDRVELHPGCDLWMRGATHGQVAEIGRKWIKVRMDHPQVKRLVKATPDLLCLRTRR